MKKKVLVAMSGGVDSSVAAYLLKEQGYEVIGATMCFGLEDKDGPRPSCCSISGIDDARKVAQQLGIPHYALSFGRQLKQYVIKDFLDQYLQGRTPNPCVRCNQYLKFGLLFKKAREIGCEYLATGHHARITFYRKKKEFLLRKGRDKAKDQSYFLFRIPKEILPFILFPVGGMTKDAARGIARRENIKVADKPGSQDICFIPGRDYRKFIVDRLGARILKPGIIRDMQGRCVGKHRGLVCYTIGQRQGLGIAHSSPLYVVNIGPKKNEITAGEKKDVYRKRLIAAEPNFLVKKVRLKKLAVGAVIRYNHPQSPAKVSMFSKGRLSVEFKKPQPAVTPGQSIVFYDKGIVLGGAIIEKAC